MKGAAPSCEEPDDASDLTTPDTAGPYLLTIAEDERMS